MAAYDTTLFAVALQTTSYTPGFPVGTLNVEVAIGSLLLSFCSFPLTYHLRVAVAVDVAGVIVVVAVQVIVPPFATMSLSPVVVRETEMLGIESTKVAIWYSPFSMVP